MSIRDDAVILGIVGAGAWLLWKNIQPNLPKIDIGGAMAHDSNGNVDIGKTWDVVTDPEHSAMSNLTPQETRVIQFGNDHDGPLVWNGNKLNSEATVISWAYSLGLEPALHWWGSIDVDATLVGMNNGTLKPRATGDALPPGIVGII